MSKLFQKPWRDGLRAAIAEESERMDDPEVGLSAPAALHLLDCADALTTIALAAGLGADASAAEVAARVGEMRGALVAIGRYDEFDRKRLAPTAHAYGHHAEAVDFARRLAEEAGRG